MTKRADIIRQHIPNLTEVDEQAIHEQLVGPEVDVANLAIRTCRCGQAIDGYYDYTDHLIAVLEAADL